MGNKICNSDPDDYQDLDHPRNLNSMNDRQLATKYVVTYDDTITDDYIVRSAMREERKLEKEQSQNTKSNIFTITIHNPYLANFPVTRKIMKTGIKSVQNVYDQILNSVIPDSQKFDLFFKKRKVHCHNKISELINPNQENYLDFYVSLQYARGIILKEQSNELIYLNKINSQQIETLYEKICRLIVGMLNGYYITYEVSKKQEYTRSYSQSYNDDLDNNSFRSNSSIVHYSKYQILRTQSQEGEKPKKQNIVNILLGVNPKDNQIMGIQSNNIQETIEHIYMFIEKQIMPNKTPNARGLLKIRPYLLEHEDDICRIIQQFYLNIVIYNFIANHYIYMIEISIHRSRVQTIYSYQHKCYLQINHNESIALQPEQYIPIYEKIDQLYQERKEQLEQSQQEINNEKYDKKKK